MQTLLNGERTLAVVEVANTMVSNAAILLASMMVTS